MQAAAVRVYIPVSAAELRLLSDTGQLPVECGWSATAALLQAYGLEDDDLDMGEAVAMALASGASRPADADTAASCRRVIAADIEDDCPETSDEPGRVRVPRTLLLPQVVSIHIDAAATRPPRPDELEDVAQLQWFDVAEVADAAQAPDA